MKMYTTLLKRIMLSTFVLLSVIGYSQTKQLSREEIAIQKAEERVERYRLKLVDVKRDIESADSLFVAGEKFEKEATVRKAEAKDEIKAIKKQYKLDSKPAKKKEKNKDRAISSEGRAELREITGKYKADLRLAERKYKDAESDISKAGRMMDKADKKLDLLKTKLKSAEKSYEDAEETLNEKKNSK